MAWIRSEQALPRHPKTLFLISLLGLPLDTTLGRLHLLWWWCLDFAIDGDLSRKEPKVIENACQIPLKLLIKAGFVDGRPYRRIHGWWELQGQYLRTRFQHNPKKWQRIQHLYEDETASSVLTSKLDNSLGDGRNGRTDVPNGRTDVRNKNQDARASLEAPLALGETAGNNNGAFNMSEQPRSQFEWDHLLRRLTPEEKTRSRLREERHGTK